MMILLFFPKAVGRVILSGYLLMFQGNNLSLVSSASASADETLRLMSGYRTIVSNDSTLAFWAACLAGRRLVTPSPLLNALFDQLRAAG